MNLDLAQELEPESTDDTDFEVADPLPSWDGGSQHFDKSLNCYGVVHVRLLRAQRLPCPVGSSVCATVSLPPWQGRVRTQRTTAFLSSVEHGVCVRWDQQTNAGFCSMVNAWSSEDSPIPSIKIDLMFSPLGMGLLDFTMCSLTLACEPLMTAPGSWKQQWCATTVPHSMPSSSSQPGNSAEDLTPLVFFEAMFTANQDTAHVSDLEQKVLNSSGMDQAGGEAEVHVAISARHTPSEESKHGTDLSTAAQKVTELQSNAPEPHLLRVASFWIPTTCAVCSALILGRNQGFECEECGVHCCKDCRLHVDLQIPCGSDAARMIAEKSLQSKLSISNILSIVAPDETFTVTGSGSALAGGGHRDAPQSSVPSRHEAKLSRAVGCLRLEFVRACLLRTPLPIDSKTVTSIDEKPLAELLSGDFYARLSSSDSSRTARTRTVQNTGTPQFASSEMQFEVPHYGVEFRLDVVDASTDTVVGTTTLTTHRLLQDQRDHVLGSKISLLQFAGGPLRWKGLRPMLLELQTKSRGSVDLFGTSKQGGTSPHSSHVESTRIAGWLETRIGFEEYVDELYGMKPFKCPERPPAELNIINFQLHVSRIGALVGRFRSAWEQCLYITSWKDAGTTLSSLIVFITFTLRFDPEYCGRGVGYGKFCRSKDETKASKEEIQHSSSYKIHRPLGTLSVKICRGRGLVSGDLGIPGKVSCRVVWDPVRLAKHDEKKTASKYDLSAGSSHEIGRTDAIYSANPSWDEMFESVESKRLKQILWLDSGSADDVMHEAVLEFPVLQPIVSTSSRKDSDGYFEDILLKPWESSEGAVVVQIVYQDFLNDLAGFDHVLGEVVIPLSELVQCVNVSGWFPVANSAEVAESREAGQGSGIGGSTGPAERGEDDLNAPCIFVNARWKHPQSSKEPSDVEREISIAVQEELVRSSTLTKNKAFDIVESSVGAFNTALGISGNVQHIQNSLGQVLDAIEIMINAVNFTDPFKSSLVFLVLFILWTILMIIPTRYIILAIGMVQYGASFAHHYGQLWGLSTRKGGQRERKQKHGMNESGCSGSERQEASPVIWVNNALRSLPTGEDLTAAYAWESARQRAQDRANYASSKRISRLRKLWKSKWFASVRLRVQKVRELSNGDDKSPHWKPVFAIIQGHKFLWWDSTGAFDRGELPQGRLLLAGHSGTTGPTPLEIKALSPEEALLVVGIFGRGTSGQERITVLVPDSHEKVALEGAVVKARTKVD